MIWTPRRVLVGVVLVVVLLVAAAHIVAALWDYRKQSEQEHWEKVRNGTFFRR